MNASKRRGLGRGLDALLTSAPQKQPSDDDKKSGISESANELQQLSVDWLKPGKYQPRKDMSDQALEELSHSIKAQGIIQPIVVRQIATQQYEIIAGERRWRAAKLAGLVEVPCLVKDIPDEAAVAMALIENIQREDLNAMEEAIALERLLTEFDLTHQQVADAVGKSRTTVTNLLRLNSLNDDVKTLLEHGDIEMGHARALLALSGEQQSETAKQVAAKELTVRETERLVKKVLSPQSSKQSVEKNAEVQQIEQNLAEKLGAEVKISQNKQGKGKLTINYKNSAQLAAILSKISVE
jgi:ParB family chromosome partitioning protein